MPQNKTNCWLPGRALILNLSTQRTEAREWPRVQGQRNFYRIEQCPPQNKNCFYWRSVTFCCGRDGTQGFLHAGQMLYHWAVCIPAPWSVIFNRKLFCWFSSVSGVMAKKSLFIVKCSLHTNNPGGHEIPGNPYPVHIHSLFFSAEAPPLELLNFTKNQQGLCVAEAPRCVSSACLHKGR